MLLHRSHQSVGWLVVWLVDLCQTLCGTELLPQCLSDCIESWYAWSTLNADVPRVFLCGYFSKQLCALGNDYVAGLLGRYH